MTVIATRDLIRNIAARFRRQYPKPDPGHRFYDGSRPVDIQRKLDALDGETATAEEVEAILKGWLDLRCDECKQLAPAVVEVGDAPDYESSTARLCLGCASKALALLSPSHCPE